MISISNPVSRTKSFVFEYTTNNAGVAVSAGVATFTPPAGWVSCLIDCTAGGAGGGSGRRSSTGIRLGGTGGLGGNRSVRTILASQVAAGAWTITVGGGGPGGLAPETNDTDGSAGTGGGGTKVERGATILLAANWNSTGGSNGTFGSYGGTSATSISGNSGAASGTSQFFSLNTNGVTSLSGAAASIYNYIAGTSGPGGGSLNAAHEPKSPGTGNAAAQTGGAAAGAAGGPGSAPTGTATGWGTGGAGSGAGYNGVTGAPGGNGTGGVAILVFSF